MRIPHRSMSVHEQGVLESILMYFVLIAPLGMSTVWIRHDCLLFRTTCAWPCPAPSQRTVCSSLVRLLHVEASGMHLHLHHLQAHPGLAPPRHTFAQRVTQCSWQNAPTCLFQQCNEFMTAATVSNAWCSTLDPANPVVPVSLSLFSGRPEYWMPTNRCGLHQFGSFMI